MKYFLIAIILFSVSCNSVKLKKQPTYDHYERIMEISDVVGPKFDLYIEDKENQVVQPIWIRQNPIWARKM